MLTFPEEYNKKVKTCQKHVKQNTIFVKYFDDTKCLQVFGKYFVLAKFS
jgi:hypothetical protein